MKVMNPVFLDFLLVVTYSSIPDPLEILTGNGIPGSPGRHPPNICRRHPVDSPFVSIYVDSNPEDVRCGYISWAAAREACMEDPSLAAAYPSQEILRQSLRCEHTWRWIPCIAKD